MGILIFLSAVISCCNNILYADPGEYITVMKIGGNEKMKKTLKNLALGATLAGALSLFGCSDNRNMPHYSHSGSHEGIFNGCRVETRIGAGPRYITIYEDFGTRGYKPAQLRGADNDGKFGFEDIQLFAAHDIITGIDPSKISVLEKFNNPTELERIFAYINADIG